MLRSSWSLSALISVAVDYVKDKGREYLLHDRRVLCTNVTCENCLAVSQNVVRSLLVLFILQ